MKVGGFTFTFVSVFFIIWTFWYSKDLNAYLYFGAIFIVSTLSAYGVFMLLKSISKKLLTLNSLSEKIPKLHSDIEYINGIADLMPEDDNTITYKAMLDSTGDDLRNKYEDIERDLQSIDEAKEVDNNTEKFK